MKNNQTMTCDLETGICGVSERDKEMEIINFNEQKKTIHPKVEYSITKNGRT